MQLSLNDVFKKMHICFICEKKIVVLHSIINSIAYDIKTIPIYRKIKTYWIAFSYILVTEM
jgi:hypothetical protein